MDHAENNPSTNQLGPGLTDDQIKAAISKSGYPLQIVVGNILQAEFRTSRNISRIQHEWGYLDRDSKELRTIDLHGQLWLFDLDASPRVRPQVDILIECKQSQMPLVFFKTGTANRLDSYPVIAGLRNDKITITTDDDPSSWNLGILSALDLEQDAFQTFPPCCQTLSKCVRKGTEVELSGSESYNGIVLPLTKAVQHFVHSRLPVETAQYFDCHMTVAVAVVDAPMVCVDAETGMPALTASPWVRVFRHEYEEDAEKFDRDQMRVIDVVHKDYFQNYLQEHLLPFANRFAQKVLRHPLELATGRAFASGMGEESWSNIESRLSPSSLVVQNKRVVALGKGLLRFIFRKKNQNWGRYGGA